MFVALHPESPSRQLISALLANGYQPIPVATIADVESKAPPGGWAAAVVELATDVGAATVFAAKAKESLGIPVLLVSDRLHTEDLLSVDGFDDFILSPIDVAELRVRLNGLSPESGMAETSDEILLHEDLELNTATYQAAISGTPQDLTYMEYELLRFFVENPVRVWSREQILAKVWGYDYFGGSRTVDVHVRRLRAKLGEERASWISTVRSVGYRFG